MFNDGNTNRGRGGFFVQRTYLPFSIQLFEHFSIFLLRLYGKLCKMHHLPSIIISDFAQFRSNSVKLLPKKNNFELIFLFRKQWEREKEKNYPFRFSWDCLSSPRKKISRHAHKLKFCSRNESIDWERLYFYQGNPRCNREEYTIVSAEKGKRVPRQERVIAITAKDKGATHPLIAQILGRLADLHLAAGDGLRWSKVAKVCILCKLFASKSASCSILQHPTVRYPYRPRIRKSLDGS